MKISPNERNVQPPSRDFKIALLFSRFNSSIGNLLLDGIFSGLTENGIKQENIDVIKVPGALELPLAAQKIAKKNYDVIIASGIVIKGDTYHFEIVSNESHRALMDISLKYDIPVIFGLICAYSEEQAKIRADINGMNKGREFAETALEMANLSEKL